MYLDPIPGCHVILLGGLLGGETAATTGLRSQYLDPKPMEQMASRSPTKEDLKKAIREIVLGIKNLEKRLGNDVTEVCKLLISLIEKLRKAGDGLSLTENRDLKSKLQNDLSDIYCCLKLHMAFHLGKESALKHKELKEFGRDILKLSDEQINANPDISHAIDPGSKILEMLNSIVECPTKTRGSKEHADEVMEIASALFCRLKGRNRFRPKVLAKVSHNGRFFVGSSMSVSQFLRPLCLHSRVVKFKRSLQKAVVFDEALSVSNNQAMNWSSSAFINKDIMERKAPCTNCQKVFENLRGFISTNGKEAVDNTFLGACAEYVPVNELIEDDREAFSADDSEMFKKLQMNKKRCLTLFKEYQDIADECWDAYDSGEVKQLQAAYAKVTRKIHIFGFKPEIKM